MRTLIIATAVIAMSFTMADTAPTWSLDKSHASLEFGITHLGLSEVKGRFTNFDVKITGGTKTDFSDISATMTAQTSSISTGDEGRDNHLKGAEFFNAETNKEITFKTTAVKSAGKGKLKVTGDLTMNGVTKAATLDVEPKGAIDHPYTKKKAAGFKVTGKIKRSDYKFGPASMAGALSDDVNIYANFEVSKD
ncbi:MAG: YceI family protein [Flavobacteriales bacterium]